MCCIFRCRRVSFKSRVLGLNHAHHAKDTIGNSRSIVHRDISPQNIMVRNDGVAKIVDFGIAKASNRSTRTATGVLKGKLQYRAPEQVQGMELDGRSDQFALGVCLWEMCTGQRLFEAENDIQTLTKILKDPIPAPTSLISGFPRALEAAIMRMLARSPRSPRSPLSAFGRGVERPKSVFGEQLMKYRRTRSRRVCAKNRGDDLDKTTENLSPTQGNFMLTLGPGGTESRTGFETNTPQTDQSVVTQMQQQRSSMALALGVVGALFLTAIVRPRHRVDAW
ncbi:MAG: serine/threonine protein kinase [Deltaproteobacteria bacterium]|nr:serine/threonine protein kinase [Deltaproteobacteria bacterium]